MIVDTSALVALLRDEPEAVALAHAMAQTPQVRVSAATALETSIVVGPATVEDLDSLLAEVAVVVPFDHAQMVAAREAYARYGRGSGARAKLNFGDCFSYALAKVTGEPLLFKGEDFTHTDVAPAR